LLTLNNIRSYPQFVISTLQKPTNFLEIFQSVLITSLGVVLSVKMLRVVIILVAITIVHAVENVTKITHQNIVTIEEDYYPNYVNKKEESARKFLQYYNSFNPVVLLVENTQQSQNNANNFFKTVHKLSPQVANINFMMMKFNASGKANKFRHLKLNRML
jgi:hypothetical protein